MTNLEQLENLLAGWEASYKMSMTKPDQTNEAICYGGVKALKDALRIFKRPSNTQMHMDTKPKHHYRHCGAIDHKEDAKYCYSCGGRL